VTNEELDYEVAKVATDFIGTMEQWKEVCNKWMDCGESPYRPSTNWQQAGELLEKYKIELWRLGDNWKAGTSSLTDGVVAQADTPQRAICLAMLAAEGVE
jgi:hypothetical protein